MKFKVGDKVRITKKYWEICPDEEFRKDAFNVDCLVIEAPALGYRECVAIKIGESVTTFNISWLELATKTKRICPFFCKKKNTKDCKKSKCDSYKGYWSEA